MLHFDISSLLALSIYVLIMSEQKDNTKGSFTSPVRVNPFLSTILSVFM